MHVAIAHVLVLIFLSITAEANEESGQIHYTNSWAVHVDDNDLESITELAKKHGFTNLGQIGSLPGYFHFVKESTKQKNKRSLDEHTELLLAEPTVKWVKQQRVLERSKRNIFHENEDITSIERERRDIAVTIQDPFFKDQWYLQNIGQSSGPGGLDINILPAWGQGYSGKGVVVSILDDGVDHTHPDLMRNYDPDASFDFNDFDPDPKPQSKDPLMINCHGTKCAGEVAAEANNGICGVGVSFNASIGGIRMLDGKATDTIEGSSLSYHSDYIDIYTCCWGPKDDGKRFGKPGFLASKALKIGAERGRGGKGNIFVWATGNGGLTDDDCNCDGYTTSIYTVSIGAISDHGLSTYYTETCASTLAVTFSGASHREAEENKIVTTGLNHKCTKTFKGTSSAAPLASGMLALVLEANPNLTWRDVQHIIVETSQKTSPLDEGWKKNGAGKEYNHKFGFGKLDAMRMIERARSWENVPKQKVCYGKEHDTLRNIPSSGVLIASSNTSSCVGPTSEIRKLEHVQVKISLKHRHRGRLSITLISPSGSRSELLKTRRNDHSTQGLTDWVFMTVHFWGEDPRGSWTLIVTDNDRNTREHHVTKAKQGDFEDVTRVVMDDTEKQGPWDTNKINEYDIIEQTPPGNHTSQDHILKGMENTVGELVKGNKFIELAKRKKDRHHGAKGVVGNKSGHAQYRHKSDKHGLKRKYKTTTKKKQKHYKTESKKHKDLETKESTRKKHKPYKHKGLKKHKYRSNRKHFRKHKESTNKGQFQGEGKSLMAEGSVEIPKGRTPLEAKIAIQAFVEPYFKVSASRIVLPKRYQGFTGEVNIKMKLARERKKERMGKDERGIENHRTQLESAKEISFPKAKSHQVNTSQTPNVHEVVKENNEVQNAMHELGAKPFGISSKEMTVLEAARQNTELPNSPVGIPEESQESQGKTTNEDNVYINLLNNIKSMPHFRKVSDSSLKHLDERIDILTDAKPYSYENSTRMLKNMNNDRSNSTTGNELAEMNGTGSRLTGSNDTGSNFTESKLVGYSLNGNGFSGGNSSEKNASRNYLEDDSKGNTTYDALSMARMGNKAVLPVEIPIIVYDTVRNPFAEVNASGPKMVSGNKVTGTGSNNTGNESKAEVVENANDHEGVPDESSGLGGSSGFVIEEEPDCEESNDLEIRCQITEPANNGKLNNTVEEVNDDDDNNDDSDEIENVHVIDGARGFPQPLGSNDFKISNYSPTAKIEPPNDEDKLAFLLSTGKYQGPPGESLKQGLTQSKDLRPLNASHLKDHINVADRYNISMGPVQGNESKSLQTSFKHQNVPSASLKKGLSQPGLKRPLHQNVPGRHVSQDKGPTPSNQDIKIDLSELEPLDQFANKDFKALENALEKQVARLEKFRDDSPTGTRFLQRVKDDIRQRNVDDLKFIEDEIRNDMKDAESQNERKAYSDGDSFIAEPGEEPDNEDVDDVSEETPNRLERRQLSKRASKHVMFHREKNSKDNDKYGKGNSGLLESWTLILYGT